MFLSGGNKKFSLWSFFVLLISGVTFFRPVCTLRRAARLAFIFQPDTYARAKRRPFITIRSLSVLQISKSFTS
jgi:hypothetical protein